MKKRIFMAVDISEETRRTAGDYIAGLKSSFSNIRVGWERAEKLHLTLKFLGDTDEQQLECLREIAENAAGRISRPGFQISETGAFPSARKPRVLWLGVRGDVEKLREINSFLETECERIGFRKENRVYRPHLTIARVREPYRSGELVKTHLENSFESPGFEAAEIVVYESRLLPTGSVYEKVFSAQMRK